MDKVLTLEIVTIVLLAFLIIAIARLVVEVQTVRERIEPLLNGTAGRLLTSF